MQVALDAANACTTGSCMSWQLFRMTIRSMLNFREIWFQSEHIRTNRSDAAVRNFKIFNINNIRNHNKAYRAYTCILVLVVLT